MTSARERASRPTGTLVLFALVGLGALATLLSIREERQSAHLVDERATDIAASQIRGALASTVGSLRGADGLAVDGRVDAAEFEAFAGDVTSDSLLQAIAFSEVVLQPDRAAFEQRTHLDIHDTDGRGGFVPGVVRPRSLVVTMVSPFTSSNRPVLGFDIASDPVRLAAAEASERSGLPEMSARISTATEAHPGVAVVSAIRGPDGTTIGFLSSGLDISVAVQRAGVDIATFASFRMEMDGTPLIGGTAHGATQTFDIAGHHFAVTVDTGKDIDGLLPTLIGIGTLILLAAVTAATRRDRRQREQIALSARRSKAITDLGHALAAATDVRTVLDEVLDRGSAIMDAGHVGVALRSADHPTRLVLRYDRAVPSDMGQRLADTDAGAPRPFSECVREGVDVIVTNRAALVKRFPDASSDADAASIDSLIWVPLMFGRDLCVGALGFTWPMAMSGGTVEERLVAAHTVAELTGRSLERAVTTMAVQSAADNLGELARALAGAHDPRDVAEAVRQHAATILGARSAELELDPASDLASAPTAVERTVENRAGTPIARLVLSWPRPTLLGPAQSSVFDTMVEMIGQTLERTALTEQEHQLIVQLQQDLLPPPPDLAGLDVAVRYRPAMSVVGLGGDFYDVLLGENGRLFVVIGDVTGHGSQAVAAMAELKAVIQSLLRGGRSLEDVCDEVDGLLSRRRMYATAQIVEIDTRSRTMRIVNAGHPFPIVRRAGGTVELLSGAHGRILGLITEPSIRRRSTTLPFDTGDALLLYTDGLIERRRQSIDVGMQHLVDAMREHGSSGSAADLVDRVLTSFTVGGDADKTDDDVALLVVRLLSEPHAPQSGPLTPA